MDVTAIIIEAIIGGIIGVLFFRIQKKLGDMDTEQKHRHSEQIEVRTAERELLLAEAEISALTARCVRGEMVNGDLEEAEKVLHEKRDEVQDITRKIAMEYIEGLQ